MQMVYTHHLRVYKIYKSEIFVVTGLGIRNVVSLLGWIMKKVVLKLVG